MLSFTIHEPTSKHKTGDHFPTTQSTSHLHSRPISNLHSLYIYKDTFIMFGISCHSESLMRSGLAEATVSHYGFSQWCKNGLPNYSFNSLEKIEPSFSQLVRTILNYKTVTMNASTRPVVAYLCRQGACYSTERGVQGRSGWWPPPVSRGRSCRRS